MTRPKKALQRDKRILNRLKEDALQFVQRQISGICSTSKIDRCSCLKVLPRVFVDAVKNLPGGLDEEHTVDELTGWLSQVYEHLLLYTVQSDGDNSCAIVSIGKGKKRLGNFYTPRDLARFTAKKRCTNSYSNRQENSKVQSRCSD